MTTIQGGSIMLAAGVMNGIIILIQSIIGWCRRVRYALKGAIIVPATCEKAVSSNRNDGYQSEIFRIAYEGSEYSVKVTDLATKFQVLPVDEPVNLVWVPGTEKALLSTYREDEKSRKTLLICDVLSLVGLTLMILGIVLIATGSRSDMSHSHAQTVLMEAFFLGGIALMIIMSIIRRNLRKYK